MEERDRREFFRIRDALDLSYRRIDLEEARSLAQSGLFAARSRMSERIEHVVKKHVFRDEDGRLLANFLVMLDEKLSAIIDLLSDARTEEPFMTYRGDVEISGSGLSFSPDAPLAKDDILELRVQLPVHPYLLIPTLARVMNVEEDRQDDTQIWRVACKFTAIADGDRDALVTYIFARDREEIRLRKKKGAQGL